METLVTPISLRRRNTDRRSGPPFSEPEKMARTDFVRWTIELAALPTARESGRIVALTRLRENCITN